MADTPSKPTSKNPLAASLLQLAGQTNVITVRRPFVNFTGSLEAAMLLDQLLYWTPRSVMGGWVAKSDVEFQEELCLKRYSVRAARDRLLEMKLIKTTVRRFNNFPTQHYLVDMGELTAQWTEYVSRLSENGQTDCAKSDSRSSENGQTLTEPTSRDLNDDERETSPKFEISDGLQESLKELGIYVSIWKTVEKRIAGGWTEADVKALINWMIKTAKNKTKAAQGFVTRVREGTKAPKEFYPRQQPVATEDHSDDQDIELGEVGISYDQTVTPAVLKAWSVVVEQLGLDMKKTWFEEYVQTAMPVHFEDGILLVGVLTEARRDWLESRLASSFEHLMSGAMADKVAVEFIVVEGVAVETEA